MVEETLRALVAHQGYETSFGRKDAMRLIGLAAAAHGNALSPLLGALVAFVVRRIKDNDSQVADACADVCFALARHVDPPPEVDRRISFGPGLDACTAMLSIYCRRYERNLLLMD